MKCALIDNYDSFTFNLRELLDRFSAEVTVVRNDAFELESLYEYDAIVISPGPGKPSEAGLIKEVVRKFHGVKPILGICLGMQAIAEELGGNLNYLNHPIHGQASFCFHRGDAIFTNVSTHFEAGRYHSIVVDKESLIVDMEIIADTADGLPMALRIADTLTYGLQFHPESILTPDGEAMISNFIELVKKYSHELPARKAI